MSLTNKLTTTPPTCLSFSKIIRRCCRKIWPRNAMNGNKRLWKKKKRNKRRKASSGSLKISWMEETPIRKMFPSWKDLMSNAAFGEINSLVARNRESLLLVLLLETPKCWFWMRRQAPWMKDHKIWCNWPWNKWWKIERALWLRIVSVRSRNAKN